MKLELNRIILSEDYTMGRLFIDGMYFCDTLEDKDRGLHQNDPLEDIKATKVYGQTAIPKGTYNVTYDWSNHFQQFMPHIDDVPGFEGILIHGGNKVEDTFGCVLVGEYDENHEGHLKFGSKEYSERLRGMIQLYLKTNKNITITIS